MSVRTTRPSIVFMTNVNSRTTPQIPVPKGVTTELDGVVVGNGPAYVEAYIDFQCPFCRQFELSAGAALDGLLTGGMISLVRHPMNFLDEISPTRYSSRAAAASAAAADAGMFHEYARVLFENQPPEGSPGLSDDQLIDLGVGIGIADPEFAETIQRGTYLPWPSFVTRRATERGVAGTPSVFVDGIPVPARAGSIAAAVERVLT
jgi:protein-disulfide isomerase